MAEKDLPVFLPDDIQFTGRGPSPLTQAKKWLQTSCGKYILKLNLIFVAVSHLLHHAPIYDVISCPTAN